MWDCSVNSTCEVYCFYVYECVCVCARYFHSSLPLMHIAHETVPSSVCRLPEAVDVTLIWRYIEQQECLTPAIWF